MISTEQSSVIFCLLSFSLPGFVQDSAAAHSNIILQDARLFSVLSCIHWRVAFCSLNLFFFLVHEIRNE